MVTEVRRVWVTLKEDPMMGSQAVAKKRSFWKDIGLYFQALQGLRRHEEFVDTGLE